MQNEYEKEFCCYCGEIIQPSWSRTSEHLLPKSKGGNNQPINKKACCFKCNSERGNKSYEIWVLEMRQEIENLKARKIKSSAYIMKLEARIENALYWAEYVENNKEKLTFKQQ
jgi:hypothetical protein